MVADVGPAGHDQATGTRAPDREKEARMADYTPDQLATHIFTGLPADLLQDKRDDLVARCRAVRATGWDDYRYVWSTGEVLAVAYLLDARDVLAELNEDETSVLGRWAYDLWGVSGGEEDEAAGLRRTRKWFMETRSTAVQ
jgi:hypothetical protein